MVDSNFMQENKKHSVIEKLLALSLRMDYIKIHIKASLVVVDYV